MRVGSGVCSNIRAEGGMERSGDLVEKGNREFKRHEKRQKKVFPAVALMHGSRGLLLARGKR